MVDRLKGSKVVGIKQTTKAVKNGNVKAVYICKDVDLKLVEPLKRLANEKSLKIIEIDTRKELGALCGIDVGASVAATLL